MTVDNFPDADVAVESIDPTTLKDRIDAGEEVFLLDTRAADDFNQWQISGENVEIINIPYFEFLTGDVDDELVADIPDDREVMVLCAKGGSSEYVAGLLKERDYTVNHLEDGMQGWARIYESQELNADTAATILQYQRPSSGCLAYLIISEGEAAVIDPLRAFTDEYLEDVQTHSADLTYALDTHIHADHISGIRALTAETGAMAVLPAPAADRGVEYDQSYETVANGDTFTVGDVEIDVVHTPGHTTGMTAYKVGNVLFTGDGLFTESVARPDLEDPEAAKNAAETLYESLTEKILPQAADTIVAPAHFSDAAAPNDGTYTAALGDLQESMDALSMDRDEFVEFIVADMPPRPANYEEIIATNLGQRDTDDDEAFTLELGPNNCAASDEALTGD
ncbi:MBL fold metallo-hydrolase [Halorussus sp. MSC15.2]|uniref:MBL fold metallo-hydrolase n=1 Tax=Halorussus sp. MSC15.2 TaxID=2283638 RepID=UPI0013D83BCF|nr:MBL fold metallo-hydrolase [Halorussus sp. MSC15.2]NEU58693.1 MBL fold metallo-hydrolase [Halorussus sp. MSC15.2]